MVSPDIIGLTVDLIFNSQSFLPEVFKAFILSSVETIIILSITDSGFALKIISLSRLKFCIQFIVWLLSISSEYNEPVVDKNNKLLLLSKANVLLNFDTVFDGWVYKSKIFSPFWRLIKRILFFSSDRYKILFSILRFDRKGIR